MSGTSSGGWFSNFFSSDRKIAIAALVVSLVSTLATGGQAIYAAYALRESQQNFDLSGPHYEAEARLRFRNHAGQLIRGDKELLHDIWHVKEADLKEAAEATLIVTVANTGRTSGALMSYEANLGNHDGYVFLQYSEVKCTVDGTNKGDCPTLPFIIEPGHSITLSADLMPHLPNKLAGEPIPIGDTRGYPIELELSGTREGSTFVSTDTVVDAD